MPRYWFRQKHYGFGATPNTWQGWAFVIVSTACLVALVMAPDFTRDDGLRFWLIALGLPLVVVPGVLIAHAKTEGGWRWHWGSRN
ncbi:MAG TPA: hypothetical protein VN718_06370 [Rhizomicrobium sp.]|nr:hypothetical protein [Rhizomicrobium sp.]